MQHERAGPETRPARDRRKDSDEEKAAPLRVYLETAPPETPVEEIAAAYLAGDDPVEKWGRSA